MATRKQRKAIKKAGKDGKISKKDMRELSALGISLDDVRDNKKDNVIIGNVPGNETREPTKAFEKEEIRSLQGQAAYGIQTYGGDPNEGGELYEPAVGQPNYYNYGGNYYQNQPRGGSKDSGNSLKNQDLWRRVADELHIKTVDSEEDLARMFNYVNGSGNNWGERGDGSASGEAPPADRTSGDFGDIQAALGEDQQAGLDAAAGLDSQAVTQANQYEAIIDQLMASQSSQQANFDSALALQSQQSAAQLNQLNGMFNAQYAGLQQQMQSQQQDFQNAQSFTQQQLSAANAAFLAEQQRSANLSNAYVPQANPTAQSVAYADGRTTPRKQTNNQLSDLTLMSGLGTQSNPLAGLQLA